MNKQNTILIPAEAVEASHIQPGEHIAIHVAENTLVVVPEKLTALQAVNAIALLGDVGSDLVAIVKDACGTCAERREQGLCPFVDTSSISFAPPQAAGLTHSAVSPLPTKPEGRLCGAPMRAQRSGSHGERRGKEAQWGIPEGCFPRSGLCPDDVPPTARMVLTLAGICPGHLEELLMSEEIIHEA